MKPMNEKDKDIDQAEMLKMAEDIKEIPLSNKLRNAMKERVMNRIVAPCPDGGVTSYVEESDWLQITKNLEVKVLTQDLEKKVQTAYWRLKPGTVVPAHYHNSNEDCLVIEGDIRFGEHVLFAGDFHFMKKGSTHPPMTTITGALLYLRHDIHDDLSWLDV